MPRYTDFCYIKDQAKLVHLQDAVVTIVKAIYQAAQFINGYLERIILGTSCLTIFMF